jgi:phospholipase/lecithinase/hemolysin
VGNAWYESNATEIFKEIMEVYFAQLQTLYDAGGRNFVLLNVPRECIPGYSKTPERSCADDVRCVTAINKTPLVLNSTVAEQTQEADAIALYNSYLSCGLSKFVGEHNDVVGKIINTTAAFDTAIADPQAYGAPDATCFNSDGTSCLWFNNYHPGIAINKLVAEEVAAAWNGTFF